MYQGRLDPSRLVFIDETWAKTNMSSLRGGCRKGQPLRAKAPFEHWQTMTFIAALRCDRIDAPCVFDGPINGRGFVDYVEQCLVPVLKPGDIVILDNLSSHKAKAARKAISRAGARLLFPAPVQPRSQPDRTGLLQAQTSHEEGGGANQRNRLEEDRKTH